MHHSPFLLMFILPHSNSQSHDRDQYFQQYMSLDPLNHFQHSSISTCTQKSKPNSKTNSPFPSTSNWYKELTSPRWLTKYSSFTVMIHSSVLLDDSRISLQHCTWKFWVYLFWLLWLGNLVNSLVVDHSLCSFCSLSMDEKGKWKM